MGRAKQNSNPRVKLRGFADVNLEKYNQLAFSETFTKKHPKYSDLLGLDLPIILREDLFHINQISGSLGVALQNQDLDPALILGFAPDRKVLEAVLLTACLEEQSNSGIDWVELNKLTFQDCRSMAEQLGENKISETIAVAIDSTSLDKRIAALTQLKDLSLDYWAKIANQDNQERLISVSDLASYYPGLGTHPGLDDYNGFDSAGSLYAALKEASGTVSLEEAIQIFSERVNQQLDVL